MPFLKHCHRGNIKTIVYTPSHIPSSPELKTLRDFSASSRHYAKFLEDDSVIHLQHPKEDHQRLKEADVQIKAFGTVEERPQKEINELKESKESDIEELKRDVQTLKKDFEKYKEETEQKLVDQLKFEVVDRFCKGLNDILHKNISNLEQILFILSVELEMPVLGYAPNAFILLTYYLHHGDDNLPGFFHQLPSRLHLKNVATVSLIPPESKSTLSLLSNVMNGPEGDRIQLLIYLWVIRAALADKRNPIAHPVPNLAFATETLRDLVYGPDQRALVEQILPSLVEEEGMSLHIKYFVSSGNAN